MLRVGLTGGIGSGKTTVCRAFAALGAPVYDSDSNAKRLMTSDKRLMDAIVELLGEGAYSGGELNRAYVADKIFNDKELLRSMNATVHPAVMRDFERWAAAMEERGAAYVIQENAILFEAGFDRGLDRSVTVSAPLEERVARASARDGISEDKVRERVANQMTDARRETLADYVLDNRDESLLLGQVLELHGIFMELSRK